MLYQVGSPETPKDSTKAVEWFKRLADKGDARGENALGVAYLHGYGVVEDSAVGFDWFYKAALKGYSSAQDNLAATYITGHGTPKSGPEAFHWYFESARSGDSTAQVALCGEYQRGRIVEVDPAMAYAWCLIAQGRVLTHPESLVKYLGTVLMQLTPAQLLEAKEIASSWKTNQKSGAAMPMHSRSFLSARPADAQISDLLVPNLPKQPAVRQYTRVGGCESGHWVDSVMSDGEIVKLEDGSIWQVDDLDTVDSDLWLATEDVTVCDGKLINTDDNSTVGAHQLK
jgi:hypothetical protein